MILQNTKQGATDEKNSSRDIIFGDYTFWG